MERSRAPQERFHTLPPRSFSTPPDLAGHAAKVELPQIHISDRDRVDKFAATSHLQHSQLATKESEAAYEALAPDGEGESPRSPRSPRGAYASNFDVDIQSAEMLLSDPTASFASLEASQSGFSRFADMVAGVLGKSDKFKPVGLDARVAVRRPNPVAEAQAKEEHKVEEKLNEMKNQQCTLPPLRSFTLQTPRKFEVRATFNRMARDHQIELNRNGVGYEDVQYYTAIHAANSEMAPPQPREMPPPRVSLLPSRMGPRTIPSNPKYSKVRGTMSAESWYRGAKEGGPTAWKFHQQNFESWHERLMRRTEEKLKRESVAASTHATRSFGSRLKDPYGGLLGEQAALKMPKKTSPVVEKLSKKAKAQSCSHDEQDAIYDGCEGFRVCGVCGHHRRYVRDRKSVV